MGNLSKTGAAGLAMSFIVGLATIASIEARRSHGPMVFLCFAAGQLLILLFVQSIKRRKGVVSDLRVLPQNVGYYIRIYVVPTMIVILISFGVYLWIQGTLPISLGLLVMILLYVMLRRS